MTKAELLEQLEKSYSHVKQLRNSLRNVNGEFIYRVDLREKARSASLVWFDQIERPLVNSNLKRETIEKYHQLFQKLLNLSMGNARRKTYVEIIEKVLSGIKSEIIIPIMTDYADISKISQLQKIMEKVTPEESEYLTEAIGCANHGFFRASVVLGWSAAVSRMHATVEKLGLEEFNKKSLEMKNIKTGRYKRFDKFFSVHTPFELEASVFDDDLLWVLEYWGLIDANQHDRLEICYSMRNNSAHPGDATISPENLVSFYSDLKGMVFDNPKFMLQSGPSS